MENIQFFQISAMTNIMPFNIIILTEIYRQYEVSLLTFFVSLVFKLPLLQTNLQLEEKIKP